MGLLYFAAVASVLLASALTFSALRGSGVGPGVSRRVVVSIGLGAGALILLAASNRAYALAPSPGYAVVPQSGGSQFHPPSNTGFAGGPPVVTGTSSGVNVRTSGTTVVSNGTNHIRIPIDLNVGVKRAAIKEAFKRAGFLAKRFMGPAGVALAGWEIYEAYKESGMTVCPPPDFFCKPNVQQPDPNFVGWSCSWLGTSIAGPISIADCKARVLAHLARTDPNIKYIIGTCKVPAGGSMGWNWFCDILREDGKTNTSNITSINMLAKTSTAAPITSLPGAPLTQAEQEAQIDKYLDPAVDPNGLRAQKAYIASLATENRLSDAGYESLGVAMLMPSSGVNASETMIYAPPVSSPETQVATKTTTDINGNPVKQTTTQKVTVVPKANGQGWEVKIEYPTKVEDTTTTDTSPPVIVKETTEETLQPPLPKPEDSKIDFPKDYNREATQQKILDSLSTEGAPKEEDITADGELAQVEEQSKKLLDVPEGVTESSLGIKSWLPQIPVATCVNPTVNESVTGKAYEVPICGAVNVFSHLISGVMCVFCLYGCVREVQAAIKT